ncbi:MAG TPA: hypothetical protein VKE40_18785 [Gemmataceae bacterium]|nr:hypothetical protein [Gemmataceae bacterium]
MRTVIALFAIAAVVALGLFVPRGSSAPNLGEKPVKYEYAELRYMRAFAAPPAMGGFPGGGGGPGFPGAAPPAPIAAPGNVQNSIRWTTAQEEMVTKEWEELADKLKAPAPKKESPVNVHKLRVFNALSAEGWEVLDRPAGDAVLWVFRRQVR